MRGLCGRLSECFGGFVHGRQDFTSWIAAAGSGGAVAALRMVAQFNTELFGSCTNIGECEAVCPKEIRLDVIARMNHDYLKAKWEDRS